LVRDGDPQMTTPAQPPDRGARRGAPPLPPLSAPAPAPAPARADGAASCLRWRPPSARTAVAASDSIPVWAVFVLMTLNFNEAVQGQVIFPFIPFAVQHWGVRADEVGFYVGVLIASFFLAQLLSVVAWGVLSDRFGRRPVLLVGLLGTALTMLLFGFARSYWVALLARFLTGTLNGNVAVAKVYMGEITNSKTQARGFSLLSFTWGMGVICAPAVGGFLADPVSNFGPDALLSRPQLVRDYPYILPSLVSVAVSALGLLFGFFFLPETAAWEKIDAARAAARRAADARGAPTPKAPAAAQRSARGPRGAIADGRPGRRGGVPGGGKQARSPPILIGRGSGAAAAGTGGSGDESAADDALDAVPERDEGGVGDAEIARLVVALEDEDDAAAEAARAGADAEAGAAAGDTSHDGAGAGDENDEEGRNLLSSSPGASLSSAAASPAALAPPSSSSSSSSSSADRGELLPSDAGVRDIVKNRVVMAAITAYTLLSFVQIVFDELLPVLFSTRRELGGFGFSSRDIGQMQIVQGATQISWNLLFYSAVSRRFGLINCFRVCMILWVPYFMFPAIAHLGAHDADLMWAAAAGALALKIVLTTTSFTSIMLIINNSTRGVALGAVNGFAQSAASFVRFVGPPIGGGIFSASLVFGESLGYWRLHLAYIVVSLMALATFAYSFRLPQWTNSPEPDDDEAGAGGAGEDGGVLADEAGEAGEGGDGDEEAGVPPPPARQLPPKKQARDFVGGATKPASAKRAAAAAALAAATNLGH